MRLIGTLFVAIAGLVGAGTAAAQGAAAKRTEYALIVCESPGGRDSFCPVDTRYGVTLVRDLSGRCREGQTWGYDQRGIWIRGGCRGEFEAGRSGGGGPDWGGGPGGGHGGGGEVLICESIGQRRQFCPADTRYGVRLVNQLSNAPCIRGRTWWRDERGVVVTEGCRAEFETGYRDDPYEWQPPTSGGGWVEQDAITCESISGRQRFCPADVGRSEVRLVEQLSRGDCTFGSTWGYDRRGIWVDRGCRARFTIDRRW